MIALKIKEHNESYLHQINCYTCKKKKKKKKKNRKFESKKNRKFKDHYHYTGK